MGLLGVVLVALVFAWMLNDYRRRHPLDESCHPFPETDRDD